MTRYIGSPESIVYGIASALVLVIGTIATWIVWAIPA